MRERRFINEIEELRDRYRCRKGYAL